MRESPGEAAHADSQLLGHFADQWKFLRHLTRDLLLSISDDELRMSPGAGLGPWWKQFRHVGRVEENYINALVTGTMKFALDGATYTGGASTRSLDAYLNRLDRRLESLTRGGSLRMRVDWFGESKSVGQHLLCLADHELLHHGEWIVYRRLGGGPLPKSWQAWGV